MRRRNASLTPLLLLVGTAGLTAVLVAAIAASRNDAPIAQDERAAEDPGPVHIHALGVNPDDDALFVASHTGLYRLGRGEKAATRVSDRRQDTMGFTVVAADRFSRLGPSRPA